MIRIRLGVGLAGLTIALAASACGASKDNSSSASSAASSASSSGSSAAGGALDSASSAISSAAESASSAAASAASSASSEASTTASTTATTTATTKKIKVGLVTDVGGLNDGGFNHLSYVGAQRAVSDLGATLTTKESRSPADYIPNLTNLAGQGNDLVVGVGFLMESAVGKVAKQYPNVKFAIVDDSATAKGIGGAKNVEGLLFAEQQAGYLAGYLVGSLIKSGTYAPLKGATTISSVGGIAVPSVVRYIAGYQHGATDADPGIKLLNGYSQDFVDKSKCKALAEAQIAQGSKVVFQVAGNCGAGALAAAGEKKVLGIGVDINQAPLGPQILTSAIKKVDEAVFGAAKQVAEDTFKGGTDTIFSLEKGGVGIEGTRSDVPADILAKVTAVQEKITSGALKVPETPIKN